MAYKKKLLIFDVNETLLDLSKIKDEINTTLNSGTAFNLWFLTLLQYSLVESIIGSYHPFGEIGKATLMMTAKNLDKQMSGDAADRIIKLMTELPPHPDVQDGLRELHDAGFSIVALTNSVLPAARQQISSAGLDLFFQDIYSVNEVQVYKPHPATYLGVAKKLKILPGDCIMIAAHGWDLAGAKQAGLLTAFIERKGQSLYPLAPAPDFTGKDLVSIAGQIINAFS
ncbi:MAG: haloacid dehalogenase type II [Mucilaginibacter sp.]